MNTTAKRRKSILLNYSSGVVTVETEDEDRFVISARKAVEACRQQQQTDQVISTFKQKFLGPLREWCEEHASRIDSCYVVPAGQHLDVFVVGATERYDFDLGLEVSRLGQHLFNEGWRVNTLQIPLSDPDEQETYFSPDDALEVYAVRHEAREQGDQ